MHDFFYPSVVSEREKNVKKQSLITILSTCLYSILLNKKDYLKQLVV